jgi:hypothetical protein
MRQIQGIARPASGMDRLWATRQSLLKLPPIPDQVLGLRMKALDIITDSATTNPSMADLERVDQEIGTPTGTVSGGILGSQLKAEHVVPIDAPTCPFSDGADRCP